MTPAEMSKLARSIRESVQTLQNNSTHALPVIRRRVGELMRLAQELDETVNGDEKESTSVCHEHKRRI